MREWIRRRYIEADYRFLEAKYGCRWWDDRYVMRRYRIREFWARLDGRK